MRSVLGVLAAVGLTLATRADGDGPRDLRISDRINRYVTEQNGGAQAGFVMAFTVVSAGGPVAAGGFGSENAGRKVDEHSVFRIGSISKQFTAAAVLDLLGKGAKSGRIGVTLETPALQLLTDAVALPLDGSPPITVRNLLSMTSGLPNFTRHPPRSLDPWGRAPAADIFKALSESPPREFPGSFEYSNSNYFLLAQLIDRLALPGRPVRSYETTVREDLLRPLGLEDTGFADDPVIRARLVPPLYRRRPAFLNPDWLRGSADLASSASDIATWISALFGGRILSDGARREMLGDGAHVDVWTFYGMGWFVTHRDGRDTWFHSGAVPGYTSIVQVRQTRADDWTGVVLLSNGDRIEGLDTLAEDLLDLAGGQ